MARLEAPDVPSLQFGTGQYAIAVVVHPPATALTKSLWDKDGNNGGVLLASNPGTSVVLNQGGAVAVAPLLDTTHFHYLIARGPALELTVDGVTTVGQVASNNANGLNAVVYICSNGDVGEEIAEVIAVKGPLSDPDLAKLKGYFHTKFNL